MKHIAALVTALSLATGCAATSDYRYGTAKAPTRSSDDGVNTAAAVIVGVAAVAIVGGIVLVAASGGDERDPPSTDDDGDWQDAFCGSGCH